MLEPPYGHSFVQDTNSSTSWELDETYFGKFICIVGSILIILSSVEL